MIYWEDCFGCQKIMKTKIVKGKSKRKTRRAKRKSKRRNGSKYVQSRKCHLFAILDPYTILNTCEDDTKFDFINDIIPEWPDELVLKLEKTQYNAYMKRNNTKHPKSRQNFYFLFNHYLPEKIKLQSKWKKKDVVLYIDRVLPAYLETCKIKRNKRVEKQYGYRSVYFEHLRGRHIQTIDTLLSKGKMIKKYPELQKKYDKLMSISKKTSDEGTPIQQNSCTKVTEKYCACCTDYGGIGCTGSGVGNIEHPHICKSCLIPCEFCDVLLCLLCDNPQYYDDYLLCKKCKNYNENGCTEEEEWMWWDDDLNLDDIDNSTDEDWKNNLFEWDEVVSEKEINSDTMPDAKFPSKYWNGWKNRYLDIDNESNTIDGEDWKNNLFEWDEIVSVKKISNDTISDAKFPSKYWNELKNRYLDIDNESNRNFGIGNVSRVQKGKTLLQNNLNGYMTSGKFPAKYWNV